MSIIEKMNQDYKKLVDEFSDDDFTLFNLDGAVTDTSTFTEKTGAFNLKSPSSPIYKKDKHEVIKRYFIDMKTVNELAENENMFKSLLSQIKKDAESLGLKLFTLKRPADDGFIKPLAEQCGYEIRLMGVK